jgi:hypothetical protein
MLITPDVPQPMTRDELLARLAGLCQARVGQVRVPHKPLLLLWLFGQFAATGSSAASCAPTPTRMSGRAGGGRTATA